MKDIFELTLQHRKNLYHILTNTLKEDLLQIPQGFRNNIWWNITHVVVTQQLLTYGLSGEPLRISDAMVAAYKKGTEPKGTVSDSEIVNVGALLTDTILWTQEDYDKGLFVNFTPYTTSAKVTLSGINEAIAFNLYHEGLHYGSVLALKKLVGGER